MKISKKPVVRRYRSMDDDDSESSQPLLFKLPVKPKVFAIRKRSARGFRIPKKKVFRLPPKTVRHEPLIGVEELNDEAVYLCTVRNKIYGCKTKAFDGFKLKSSWDKLQLDQMLPCNRKLFNRIVEQARESRTSLVLLPNGNYVDVSPVIRHKYPEDTAYTLNARLGW